jgi:hypothetical protein
MRIGLALLVVVMAEPAQAHDPIGGNSFWSGLLHPWFAPAHLLALAGLSLLYGAHAGPARRVVAAALALGFVAGAIAISRGVGETSAPEILLLIAAAAGALTAAALVLPAAPTAAMALITGIAIALDSPPQAIRLSLAQVIQLGTGIGTLITLLVLGEIAARTHHTWAHLGQRLLGAWIAAIAILTIAFRLAR